ncbi:hypothetical protein RINTHM_4520 [Richelia intracellularis HM01]|nr:hypothetical protein RINTHM_4520 [Richelia intracellularis HM01]
MQNIFILKGNKVNFILPIAPKLDLETLINSDRPDKNHLVKVFGGSSVELLYT